MRDSDFSSIDDYMSEPTAEDYNDSTTSTGASFGMGSGDDFATGNASDFTIGIDPNNLTIEDIMAGSNTVPNVFDLGGGVGDFGFGNTRSQNFLNPQLAEMYKQQEIARTGVNLDKNPYVDSFFTKLFGDTIDRRTDLGEDRIQEINDLRARQAFGLPSLTQKLADGKTPAPYTSKDFEVGRDTQQGIVTALPKNMFQSFLEKAPLIGPTINLLGNTPSAPLQSQMYRDAQAEANSPGIMSMTGDFLTDIANTAESIFSGIFSGKPKAEPFDEVNPNYSAPRVNDFNQFTPSSSIVPTNIDREVTDSAMQMQPEMDIGKTTEPFATNFYGDLPTSTTSKRGPVTNPEIAIAMGIMRKESETDFGSAMNKARMELAKRKFNKKLASTMNPT